MAEWLPTRRQFVSDLVAGIVVAILVALALWVWKLTNETDVSRLPWSAFDSLTPWQIATIILAGSIFAVILGSIQIVRRNTRLSVEQLAEGASAASPKGKVARRRAWPLGVGVTEIGVGVAPGKPQIKLGDALISHLSISTVGRPSDDRAAIATVSFYNDPTTRTPETDAQSVRSEVTIFSERFQVVTKEHEAFWVARTTGPGGIEAVDLASSSRSVDFPGSGQARELGIVLRFPREPIHSFSSSALSSTGSLLPSYAMEPTRLFVRVRLYAKGVDGDEFWFHIIGSDDAEALSISAIVKNDAPFSIDTSVKDNWLHLVLDNPEETREFECRADILKRECADYGITPWWAKWRGKTSEQVRRVVTQAELDFIRYELPVDDAGRSLVPGVLHCHSTTLFNNGFQVRPGHPSYATMTLREVSTPKEEEDVPFSVEVSSLDPKDVLVRTILVGFRARGTDEAGSRVFGLSARFVEDAMRSL